MYRWIENILSKFLPDNWIVDRIRKGLDRDRNFPASHLIYKGVIFFKSLLLSRFFLRKCDRVGEYPRTEKKPYIINNGTITIGDHINITSRSVQCELVTYPSGSIEIGNNISINFGTTIVAKQRVSIGDNVRIGPYSMIHDTDIHVPGKSFVYSEGKPITIEDNAWINSRVLVMKGATIGEGSVIAAGSVVSGIIPPNVVAGGTPARVIKELDSKDGYKQLISTRQEEMDEICNAVKKIMAEVFEVEEVGAETSSARVNCWTSHRHEKLIESIEDYFGVSIASDDRIRMHNYEKICSVLYKSYIKKDSTKQAPKLT